jgi:hypothetical protein
MKYVKLNPTLVVFLLSAASAYATGAAGNILDGCSTIPTTAGPSINGECPYTPTVQCCFIAAGSNSQFVTQTQTGVTVTIRRNPISTVTIFGLKDNE